MAFHVRDAATDTLVRKLAQVSGLGITEAIKTAVANEIERRGENMTLAERIKPIQDRIAAARTIECTETDKEFFDSLHEDD